MGMGIFVSYHQQPVLGSNSANIYQNRDWIGLKIAETIQPKGLGQRSCENLDNGLLPGMKTIVARLEAIVELSVYRLNVVTNPNANWNTMLQVVNQIDHLWC